MASERFHAARRGAVMAARRRLVRVVDANLNRAREGLRVCEDVARLVLGSRRVFRRLRALRYGITACARRLPMSPVDLARARDSRGDLGRRAAPSRAASAEHLLLINLQRAKEALRVLEECSRVVSPHHVRAFQRLRFRAYDVERDLLLSLGGRTSRGRAGPSRKPHKARGGRHISG